MGFLIRLIFWFSLVLLALPFNVGPDENGRGSVNPIQALLAARDAVGDIAGMCGRQPEVCETGAAAVHTVTERAKLAARIAATAIEDAPADTSAAQPPKPSPRPDEPATTGAIPAQD